MNLLKTYIKLILREALEEGQIEKTLLTLDQVVDKIKNKTLIFIDTETTTLDPKKPFAQITEIAGVAYDTNTGERLGEFNMKAKLTAATLSRIEREKDLKARGKWTNPDEKTVEDLLGMTAYHTETVPYQEEAEMMEGFVDFINSFADRNPILVAHNARFDMYQIGKALERHKLPKMPTMPVVDTKALAKNYLQPLLALMEKEGDPAAEPLLRVLRPKKFFINRLGDLGTAFQVSTKHWHSAIADTEQLAGILSALINFFEERQDTYEFR
jgi:DNA polymerase III epsilon subunit-like protein